MKSTWILRAAYWSSQQVRVGIKQYAYSRFYAPVIANINNLNLNWSCPGVLIVAQQIKNPTECPWGFRFNPCPTLWVKDPVLTQAVELCHRCNSDLALLWLWCRLAAAALIWPLAWEPPYATGKGLKRQKKKQKAGVPVVAQWLTNPTRNQEVVGSILGLAQWVKEHCHKLQCRLQAWLGSGIAIAVA